VIVTTSAVYDTAVIALKFLVMFPAVVLAVVVYGPITPERVYLNVFGVTPVITNVPFGSEPLVYPTPEMYTESPVVNP
jgi:hypothetical protein